MHILKKTVNFFQLYRYICGESEVPDIYHFWGAVSLIAATVEDRVWFQKFKHSALFPNVYVLLVGPSGLGKGIAISHLARLAECAITINKYRGKVTAAHLIDHLGKPYPDEWGFKTISNPKLWLIMDELQNDLGSNPKLIEDFIYLMTELYTGSDYTIDTGTRTHGKVTIRRPLMNWFAGTNEDDLREILTKRLLRSGFTARTCFVFGDYDLNNRIPRPKYPKDYEEIFQHLCYRLWMLQRAHGPFMITEDAEAEADKWYLTRAVPEEDLLISSWKRQHDLLLKFAMILCLSDGGPLTIQHMHIMKAKEMVRKLQQFDEALIVIGSETEDTRLSNAVEKYIRRRGKVGHTEASRYFRSNRGVHAETFRRAIIDLERNRLIRVTTKESTDSAGRGRAGVVYEWAGSDKLII